MAAVGAILVAISCTGISHDELSCEHAVSRIGDCCPEVDPRLLPCVESEGGCASGEATAVIGARAAECVLDDTCEAMRSAGKCARLGEYSLVPHAKKDRARLDAEMCR